MNKKFFMFLVTLGIFFALGNNFATADDLSSIVKNNLPPMLGKIKTPTFDALTREKILITCVEK